MPPGQFRVIYADPPWSYGNSQPDTFGEQRDHYPVMSLDEICRMPILDIALPDSVLFLWTTAPMALEAAEVIAAWGFEYKAQFIWHKERHVQGHYNSVRHELLYVCTRGACQPDVRRLFPSVYTEPRTDHSRKPDYFYEVIETLYPRGRRLELFRRGPPREGWKAYGNEVVGADDS
jgi:N6-adenosine-specific RNA methylase IME4